MRNWHITLTLSEDILLVSGKLSLIRMQSITLLFVLQTSTTSGRWFPFKMPPAGQIFLSLWWHKKCLPKASAAQYPQPATDHPLPGLSGTVPSGGERWPGNPRPQQKTRATHGASGHRDSRQRRPGQHRRAAVMKCKTGGRGCTGGVLVRGRGNRLRHCNMDIGHFETSEITQIPCRKNYVLYQCITVFVFMLKNRLLPLHTTRNSWYLKYGWNLTKPLLPSRPSSWALHPLSKLIFAYGRILNTE